jgi:hypothetical protein
MRSRERLIEHTSSQLILNFNILLSGHTKQGSYAVPVGIAVRESSA